MNALIFSPSLRKIACSYFAANSRQACFSWTSHGAFTDADAICDVLDRAIADSRSLGGGIDVVGVRLPYGGERFTGPTLLDQAVISQLQALCPYAPLHLPTGLVLINELRRRLPAVPISLSFETAFFTQLPSREFSYGLAAPAGDRPSVRRFGYHGLYHEAACRQANQSRMDSRSRSSRLLSICLDVQPELAAVSGSRPLTVTSGATPLEGLPGQTTCGELDPSIVLALNSRLGLGPEQVNEILTRKSGIAALADKPVTLDAILRDDTPHKLARDVFRYRILLACGAGIAAMGGLDGIVFSGRYAQSGRKLYPWLQRKLAQCCDDAAKAACEIMTKDLHRLVADEAHVAAARLRAIA